ncbi:MAG: DUF721 domain-containing protein [Bdellovibrionota bacterium]
MGFNRILDILKKIQERNPAIAQRLKEAGAVSYWDEVVGPQIAKHARALRVQDSVLWVEVDHPVWRSELHHRKRQILEKMNDKSKAESLKDLFFVDPRKRGR